MHMPRKKPKSCTTTRVFPNQNKVVGAVTKPHIIHILADDLGWSEEVRLLNCGLGPNMKSFVKNPRQFKGSTVTTDPGLFLIAKHEHFREAIIVTLQTTMCKHPI